MSQNAVHPIAFKAQVNVANAKQLKERDAKRAQHHQAGHQPHGPAARHRHHGQHPPPDSNPPSSSSPAGPPSSNLVPVTNASVTYLCDTKFGENDKMCKLLIDTGECFSYFFLLFHFFVPFAWSSNTWCMMPPYEATSTAQDMRKEFSIQYGSGATSGNLYTDRVTLSPTLVIQQQVIGVATQASDMNGIDGILGIGPVDLTQGTTADRSPIPTVTDCCMKQGLIKTESIGIYYEPTTPGGAQAVTGELSFGGPDSSKYEGELNYVPITKTAPASAYWGIDQTISYGGQKIMSLSAGIADTGTTLCMVPQATFEAYQKATGAQLDRNTGLLTVSQEQYDRMQSMMFNIGGVDYELTKNAQIWPRSRNAELGIGEDQISLIFASMGEMENNGLCFINGYTFLQRFYSVYDTSNSQVGFATTAHTMAESN
ncbi:acid protease [Favolaschia claudopus]|uniref:Acid protease n=1 Tax=Favolaschia claudopus TaxID=2862362 RepID=A0AAW0DB24_9AGAR